MKDYARIATKIRETAWLITSDGLDVILGIFDEHRKGYEFRKNELELRLHDAKMGNNGRTGDPEGPDVINGVGILPLMGPIFGKANLMTQMSGATSLEAFKQDFRALLNDSAVSSILLQVDSPGGSSEMVSEVADEIFAGRSVKPIYAIADSTMGSAALYLGSQANSLYATPSGSVGSIGVYTVHEDQSGADAQQGKKFTYVSAGPHKVEGNPHEPLSDGARAHMQEVVDEIYGQFLSAVSRGRGVSTEKVSKDFGSGRMLTATKALDAGLIDGIVPFEKLVQQIGNQPRRLQVAMPVAAANALAASLSGYVLDSVGSGNANDGVLLDFATNTVKAINMESKEWEHSEPGTGSPPAPRTDEDGSDDPAIKGGWRRDPLPLDPSDPGAPKANKEGREVTRMDNETLAKLNQLFGLSADSSEEALLSAAETQMNELTELNKAVSMSSEEQRLAEQFPEMYAQHQELIEKTRTNDATAFASSVERFKTPTDDGKLKATNRGFSALALETIVDGHKKASMGQFNLADYENLLKTVTEGGTLEFNELGSANVAELPDFKPSANSIVSTRQAFAAEVAKIVESDKVPYRTALKMAAEKHPELANAYVNSAVNVVPSS